MKTVIRILACADGSACPMAGQYVRSCDFDAGDGRGELTTTTDPDEAKRFVDGADAVTYWQTQSKTAPVRRDGKPNRPLTAYTVDIGPAEQAS